MDATSNSNLDFAHAQDSTAFITDKPDDSFTPLLHIGALDSPDLTGEHGCYILLITLYALQGSLLGLASGTLPFIIQVQQFGVLCALYLTLWKERQSSYSAAGLFKFAMWPYGIKLLWSPIVDSLYFSKFGRRKTWIIPLQLVVAIVLWYISWHLEHWLESYNVATLAIWFGVLVLLSATQDIAVDGWALVMLSRRNLSHAASAQTIGLTAGYFVSYTLLLAFSSESFGSIISVPSYMRFLALCFVVRYTRSSQCRLILNVCRL
jgi:PAT family acetyl-CoA transporter-like MFS transporter 1